MNELIKEAMELLDEAIDKIKSDNLSDNEDYQILSAIITELSNIIE